ARRMIFGEKRHLLLFNYSIDPLNVALGTLLPSNSFTVAFLICPACEFGVAKPTPMFLPKYEKINEPRRPVLGALLAIPTTVIEF
ncbi:hypothetical protein HDU67_003846, partial [Dinochytrium kinnereticum]